MISVKRLTVREFYSKPWYKRLVWTIDLVRHDQEFRSPSGYGVYYQDFARDTVVLIPVPFNYIFGWFREGYWYIARGTKQKTETFLRQRYMDGFTEGYREGRTIGRRISEPDPASDIGES